MVSQQETSNICWQFLFQMNTDLALFDNPTKSRDRNPPYTLKVNFDQYRRNREYQSMKILCWQHIIYWFSVHLETSVYFDSFMLHARAEDRPDGNATLVGWFVALPPIAMDLHCLGKRKSRWKIHRPIDKIIQASLLYTISAVNKARPVKIGNLTFTWRAPPTDYGPLQFVASVVKGKLYS